MVWNHKPDYVNRPLGPRKERDGKYDGFGRCIYCGNTTPVGEEHIVPQALGSHLGIRKASCRKCEKETHAFEGRAVASLLHQRLNSKMKKSEPQAIRVRVRRNGIEYEDKVNPSDYPVFGYFPVFIPARIVLGLPPHPGAFCFSRIVTFERSDVPVPRGFEDARTTEDIRIDLTSFARMIAKIAYCFAVASIGLDSMVTNITDYILGEIDVSPDLFVGTNPNGIGVKQDGTLHHLRVHLSAIRGRIAVIGSVRLYAWVGSPTYHVVLGWATGVGIGNLSQDMVNPVP